MHRKVQTKEFPPASAIDVFQRADGGFVPNHVPPFLKNSACQLLKLSKRLSFDGRPNKFAENNGMEWEKQWNKSVFSYYKILKAETIHKKCRDPQKLQVTPLNFQQLEGIRAKTNLMPEPMIIP